MNDWTVFLNGPWCAALGEALVHSLWQGAAIAGLLAALNARLAARARYGAACAALAMLAVSLAATAVVCYDSPAPVSFASVPAGGFVPVAPVPPIGVSWLAPLWAAGVMLMSLRLAAGWFGARRLVQLAGPPLPESWQAVARELAEKMRVKGAFRLLESARVAGPALVGWLRPAILVPAGALCGLSAAQLEAVLAHELAHLARRDALVNLLESVAEVLLFYHPAYWWISSRIHRERERCCDDLAVAVCGSAHLYAEALLRLEEARPARQALVFAARDGDLAARIRRLLQPRFSECVEWRAALASLAGLLVMATLAAAVTLPQEAPPAPPKPPAAPASAPAPAKPAAAGEDRNSLRSRFGPPDQIVTHDGYEKWFYRRIPGVGNNVSFEFGLDRKPEAEFKAQQEAARAYQEALRAQQESLKQRREQAEHGALSLQKLLQQTETERARALEEIQHVLQQIDLLRPQIQRLEAEIERLKAEQAAKQR